MNELVVIRFRARTGDGARISRCAGVVVFEATSEERAYGVTRDSRRTQTILGCGAFRPRAASFRRQHLGVVDRHGEHGLAETPVRKDGQKDPHFARIGLGERMPLRRGASTLPQPRQRPAPRLAPRRGASYLPVAAYTAGVDLEAGPTYQRERTLDRKVAQDRQSCAWPSRPRTGKTPRCSRLNPREYTAAGTARISPRLYASVHDLRRARDLARATVDPHDRSCGRRAKQPRRQRDPCRVED